MKQGLTKTRITSIDFLRGVVMIIMALDHVRDYYHADAFIFDPLNLEKTTPVLFFTRWITHFCAPTFLFLSGASAWFQSLKKTRKELSLFPDKVALLLCANKFMELKSSEKAKKNYRCFFLNGEHG